MRDHFIQRLGELVQQDPNILLITGDLGFGVFNEFRENYPANFVNVGVAEQQMTGLATGLALEGKTTFTYSIANFATLRCLEQIRNDAAYHGANVNVVFPSKANPVASPVICCSATPTLIKLAG